MNSQIPRANYIRMRNEIVSTILANGLPYSSKLSAHTSCVNALTFSTSHQRWLASGGDDLNIYLWDFHQDDLSTPTSELHGPRGNIFCLKFSTTNRYLYSGGTDEIILQYDIEHLGSHLHEISTSPHEMFYEHEDTIRGISCHPYQDEVFLSASQDGRILNHDARASNRSTRAQDTIQLTAEATDVQFHPLTEHVFATSDSHGSVCLRDTRMAFGPLVSRTNQGVVQKYNTKLCKKTSPRISNPEVSSITFDREGTKLAVSMLHYLPTIYAVSDPNPLAVCSARNLPDGTPMSPTQRTYSNSCTIKHGSFGSAGLDNDDLYSAGSDDFCGYVWKIPSLQELAEQRSEVNLDDWAAREWPDTIAFTEGYQDSRFIPVNLSTPLFRLTGHRSIVNSIIIHPSLPYIATSGIEKDILLHSPTSSSPCSSNMQRTQTDIRVLGGDEAADRSAYFRAQLGLDALLDEDPETMTIMMFDHIIREEEHQDVFDVRRWRAESESSSSDEESDLDPV